MRTAATWRCHHLIACLCLALAFPVAADHRRDFMLGESAYVPGTDQLYLVSRQDASWRSGDHRIDVSPGIMYGAREWLTLGVDGEFVKPRGDSVGYEVTRPYVQVRITPRLSALALGLRFDYRARHDADLDDEVLLTGLLSYSADDWTYSFALRYLRDAGSGGDDAWGFHGGIRGQVSRRIGYGLETLSGLTGKASTELLLATYVDPMPQLSLHVGVGTGIVRGPALTLRTELIWRLQ
jgi:hypothetical protein